MVDSNPNIYFQGAGLKYIEQRANLYYATLTIPATVRHILGKSKFLQSTKTDNKAEAIRRARALVTGWKAEIAKAQGLLPNAKDTFWESLRRDYMATDDEDVKLVLEELAEKMAIKEVNPDDAGHLYKFATSQGVTLLAPLVEDWNKTQRGAQKSIDQKYRDMQRMSAHFFTLEALQPQRIKKWTDKLLEEGTTYSSFVRIGGGCKSFWQYLQNSGTVLMATPDPFVGAFKLALKTSVKTDTGRSGSSYTADQLSMIYSEALKLKDKSLADLIALGAYTGARVEELGRLTKETCVDGIFNIKKSKTAAGIRQVPIHTAVAPLVARMLAESKDGYLVPSTSVNQYDLRMAALGQKYTKLKTKLGFGPDLVFHSTRGTLITLMQHANVAEGVAADHVGHEKQTMSYGLYAAGSSMAQKREALALVVYPGGLGRP